MIIHERIIAKRDQETIGRYFFINNTLAERFIEDIKNDKIAIEENGLLHHYNDKTATGIYGDSLVFNSRKHILMDLLPKYNRIGGV